MKLSEVKGKAMKRNFGKDSILSYQVNESNHQLLWIGFREIKSQEQTMYVLRNGDLVKVWYTSNYRNPKSISDIYFYENNKLVYKRECNTKSPESQKFLDDISYFKKVLSLL